ncbi:MAG: hypothetical protein RL497_2579 [Pseudomonadota bacterium]|jgi:hypothetical protein
MAWRWCHFCLIGVLCGLTRGVACAEESAISRTTAAQLAQQAFGGKVISVDEVEPQPTPIESEEPSPQTNARFVVKLMQNGRVRVVNLDSHGTPIGSTP